MDKEETEFTVKTYECGAKGMVDLHSLMTHLQEIAYVHAERYGFGYSWTNENNFYWVLINFRMKITRLPAFREKVTLSTWPSGHDMIKAHREFTGLGESGEEFFNATSEWMILDRSSKMPRDPGEFDFDFQEDAEKPIGRIERLRPLKEYDPVGDLLVPHSSIDLNGHVNNTEYVRWGTDAVRRWRKIEIDPLWFHISYNAEVFEGQRVDLMVARRESDVISVRGKRKEDGKNAFLMEMRMRS